MTAMQTKLRRKQGRKSNGPPFVQLFKYMLKSPAWLSLATPAKAAYVQLAQRYDGVNNGMIAFSVRTLAQELNCSRATAARALIELEDTGFIETVKLGTFARRNRRASEYRLTTFRCDVTGELPTKRFMQIKDAIGAIPTAKPWDAEGISRRTWYRRRGTVALPTVSPKECHGLKIECQSANGTPTVSPEGQILCHGTPDGLTHETLIESHQRGGTGTAGCHAALDKLPWLTPTLVEITDPEVIGAIRCSLGPDPKCRRRPAGESRI